MRGTLLLKLLFVPMLVLGVLSFAPSVYAADRDGDSVSNTVENAAPNGGDNNYDGRDDSRQNTVASLPNPNDTAQPDSYVTLQVGETFQVNGEGPVVSDSAWKITTFEAVDVATLPSQPDGKIFPLGMFNIELVCKPANENCPSQREDIVNECDGPCGPVESNLPPANLKLIFDRVMDTSNWTTTKYDPVTDTYIDYSDNVNISTQNIGYLRTVLEWSITDGGLGDDDGTINGRISDPIGPSITVAQPAITTASAKNVATTPATTTATTIATSGLQHTGSNFAIYSLVLGFLMVVTGAILVRKS